MKQAPIGHAEARNAKGGDDRAVEVRSDSKRTLANTNSREDIRFKKWRARRRCAFAHPTHFSVDIDDLLVDVDG
jgi:hypothetical protein